MRTLERCGVVNKNDSVVVYKPSEELAELDEVFNYIFALIVTDDNTH